MKITKDQILPGAVFNTKIGEVKIKTIDKDGYKKGCDRVNTELFGKPYSDTKSEIVSFINQNM
jgi:hypothetical protein